MASFSTPVLPPTDLDPDLDLLVELQRLTPAERLRRHEQARLRLLMVALRQAGRRHREGQDAGAPEDAD